MNPTISAGPRAGTPRPINDIILDGVTRARHVAIQLKHEGFTVIGMMVDTTIPTLQVMAGRKTDELILRGEACYYKWCTSVTGQRQRHGQFKLDDVRILWVETGYPS